jgi:hypothetical protein
MTRTQMEILFPNLRGSSYEITSPYAEDYNCIAWAAGDTSAWWWPDSMNQYYWPPTVPRMVTLESFINAYETLGYKTCNRAGYEEGFEKISIYVDSNGKPTHAARQIETGRWISKLGKSEDIVHDFEGVSDSSYGAVAVIMKRPQKSPT